MSDDVEKTTSVVVDIGEWVGKARADPAAYLERQATEVFLAAIGMAEPYCRKVFLKGGVLMGVVYQSPRQTGDIDFSTSLEPRQGFAENFKKVLNQILPRAAAELGYPDLMCSVQSFKYFPKGEDFPKFDGPAIAIKIGYARRGSRQQKLFEKDNAPDILAVDISFKEPIGAIQIITNPSGFGGLRAYSLNDLIAEKFRAQLQQEQRNRYRRQDIYDIDHLIGRFDFTGDEKIQLHDLLLKKCFARNVVPNRDALSHPEIARRARKEWHSLEQEVGEIPDFDECFARVNKFYRSLPWLQ